MKYKCALVRTVYAVSRFRLARARARARPREGSLNEITSTWTPNTELINGSFTWRVIDIGPSWQYLVFVIPLVYRLVLRLSN